MKHGALFVVPRSKHLLGDTHEARLGRDDDYDCTTPLVGPHTNRLNASQKEKPPGARPNGVLIRMLKITQGKLFIILHYSSLLTKPRHGPYLVSTHTEFHLVFSG